MGVFLRLIILIISLLLSPSALSKNETVMKDAAYEKHCDVTGPDLRAMSVKDVSLCSDACKNEKNCRGFSFISGWNRCFLKKEIKSRHKVRMFAGKIEDSKDDVSGTDKKIIERKIIVEGYDKDLSGKDFKKVAPENNKDKCAESCKNDAKCKAFVLVEGYQVCWLKESVGNLKEKIFYCGLMK